MACATTVDVRVPGVIYTPSMWDDTFISFSLDDQVQEKYAKAIEELKEEAKSMLSAETNTTIDKLVLIDTFERLGVAYHFDQEIEDQLEEIFNLQNEQDDDYDLFTTALRFRLLRQHRHHASSSVFNKFKDDDNKFKATLSGDAKGLLSLYEAAHLRIHGEQVLEEALAFTTQHLKRMAQHGLMLKSPLEDQVKRALLFPLHRAVQRLETPYYISFYEKDVSRNELLLKLAKLDFNYVQNLHKKELCQLFRWWNEFDLMSKLRYTRARLVEGYIWAMAFVCGPQYSDARVEVAKVVQLLTVINDTYDNYATNEEADLFTETVERWNIDEIDQLPDSMKIVFRFILDTCDDYERLADRKGKSFVVPYAKESVIQTCRAYNRRLKWLMGRSVMPSLEHYLVNSVFTSCIYSMSAWMIPDTGSAYKETIDWLVSEPKIIRSSAEMCRYLNDLAGYERESKLQGQTQTAIDWYMKKHDLSMKETMDKFLELAEDAWKDLNTDWISSGTSKCGVPKDIVEQVLNYARASELSYRTREDGFSRPDVMAPNVVALFMDPTNV